MTIEEKFQAVPRPIRAWFWRDETDEAILEIEKQFGLSETETVIPRSLFSVEIRELPLSELEGELTKGLNLTPAVGSALYKEVKRRLLDPIGRELFAYGIGTAEDFKDAVAPTAMPMPEAQPQATVVPPVAPSSPASPAMPRPVSLYTDSLVASSPIVTQRLGSIGSSIGTGDISGTVPTAPPASRPARVNLGMPEHSSAKMDAAFRSIFVERETPKVQAVDYGATRTTTQETSSAPVPLTFSAAPFPAAATPEPFTPHIESTPTLASQTEEPAASGVFESFMRRVAPWHYAKFATKQRATDELATPLPSQTVDYSDAPVATPQPTGALPIDDLPAPPPAA